MVITNRRIKYFLVASAFAGMAILSCLLIERYANTALNSEISFNYDSGFYDEPIVVEITTGSNYFITYTLDSSAPSVNSARYENPILIKDATENDNIWSIREDTSLRYFEKGHYKIPDYKVDKCTVLRVAAFDYSGNLVNSDVKEYFVGFDEKKGYSTMYNLCVVSDPEGLFSAEEGIYSVGNNFIPQIESGEIRGMFHDGFWDGGGTENWNWSGRESERQAIIELFSPSGELLTHEECGIRIRGGESRRNTQKPLGFYAREEYSGYDHFVYDIFGDGAEGPKNFLIHNSGDDFDVKLFDYVVYNALSNGDMSFEISPTVPCNLFLEGEYWGPMYLMKDINCETLGYNYDISANNIVLVKSGEVKLEEELEEIVESELDRFEDLLSFIRCNDMSNGENYDYVCSLLDMENFTDYVATEIYIANADWHINNNSAFWRALKPERGNLYSDGKYRCALFDVNWSFESEETMTREHYNEWDLCDMVHDLCQNENFRDLYLDKVSKMEILFAPDRVQDIIDEWSSVMEEPIRCHFKRFGIDADADEMINEEKDQILNFCINRPEEMKKVNEWMFRE